MLIFVIIFIVFLFALYVFSPAKGMSGTKQTDANLNENVADRPVKFDLSETYIEINSNIRKVKMINSTRVEVAGIHIGNRKALCLSCYDGEELDLVREPRNKFDKNAVKIVRRKNSLSNWGLKNYGLMGYVPAMEAPAISKRLKEGALIRAFFESTEDSLYSSYCEAYISIIEFEIIDES
jgi:hypothetical protein